jgi:hypothetical protein
MDHKRVTEERRELLIRTAQPLDTLFTLYINLQHDSVCMLLTALDTPRPACISTQSVVPHAASASQEPALTAEQQ